jgi:peptidoglycan/xylan/chitin deacetylase (PgdA/CDA1 family)
MGVHVSASSNRLFFLYHELRAAPTTYSYVMQRDEFEQHADLFLQLRSQPNTTLYPEITFDDGHLSIYEVALPALAARNLTATFFLTVGWIATRPNFMDWNQVQALHSAGQQIGAHGWSHTLLTHCDNAALQKELHTARLTLEDKLGASITTMSLPGGRYNQRVLAACKVAGYTHVYTSNPRAEPADLPSLIGRLNLRSNTTTETLAQLLDTRSGALAKLQRQDKWKSALKQTLGDRLYAKLWATLNRQEPEADPAEAETPLP